MAESEARVRVFFALWPHATLAQTLAQHARDIERVIGGRVTRTESIHLTLVFVGEVEASFLPALRNVPTAIKVPSFDLSLDQIGSWSHNGIGWIAPSNTPEALRVLHQGVSDAVADLGVELDRRPFTPHVTLVRRGRSRMSTTPIARIIWRVSEYVLVKSDLAATAARYDVIGRYSLDAA